MDFYEKLRDQFRQIIIDESWQDEMMEVADTRPLTVQEAIGQPDRDDYPILNGKEVMVETSFKGARGQAFTDQPGNFTGSLKDILDLGLDSNFERAVFISSLNAVLKYMGKIDKTIHCKDDEPRICADHLVSLVKEKYNDPRIGFIGYQPGMISVLAKEFDIRAVDLDPNNIGQDKAGIIIEDESKTEEILEWSDIIIATGSTIVNDTLKNFLGEKPVIFYGITASGAAYLNGWQTYCHCGK